MSNNRLKGFNGGLYVVGGKLLREGLYEDVMQTYEKIKNYTHFADESVFGLFFRGVIEELPKKYNVFVGYYNVKASSVAGSVLHFASSIRPWVPESPFFKEWQRNLTRAESINFTAPTAPIEHRLISGFLGTLNVEFRHWIYVVRRDWIYVVQRVRRKIKRHLSQ